MIACFNRWLLPARGVFSLRTDETLRSPVEAIYSFVFPPPVEVAILIEQSTFVVKSMGDLVSDHDADSAVI